MRSRSVFGGLFRPFCAAIATVLLAGGVAAASGGPAYIWLSTSSVSPPGPEAPAVAMSVGETQTLFIWARPIMGSKLRRFSLNVIADDTGVDFDDGSYTVFNTISGSVERFEYVHDSSSAPALVSDFTEAMVTGGSVDELYGLQGFTILADPDLRGIGPGCLAGETGCFEATDGSPAWLLGALDINAVAAGTVNLTLQIGDVGMNHESVATGDYNYDGEVESRDLTVWIDAYGATSSSADGNDDGLVDGIDYAIWRDNFGSVGVIESADMTDVVFGADTSLDGEPEYNALTDRSPLFPLATDDPDAVITIAAPIATVAAPEPAGLLGVLLGIGVAMRPGRILASA